MTTNQMSDLKCELCQKIFSSKYSLAIHLKKTKSCGTGFKVTYDCSYCNKKFTQKNNLEYHLANSCEQKKKQEKEAEIKIIDELKQIIIAKDNELLLKDKTLNENEKKFEDQDKYYDRLIVAEVVSKEKLRNEMRIKETIHKEQITKLEKTIEDLHTKIEKLVATKSASTVNNIINNNLNLNTFITPEFVRNQTTQFLTYDHFANGVKGIATFVHDFVLMDKNERLVYACYDKARHILRYKDDQGNEIDDIDAEKLIGIVERPIKDKYFKICKDLQEDIDRYQRILDDEDEFQSMKKDARDRKEKCERCLKVMEFQSDAVCTIGMSKNKDLSRAIEKKCLAPKGGRATRTKKITEASSSEASSSEASSSEASSSEASAPKIPQPTIIVEELEEEEEPEIPIESEENDSTRLGKKLAIFKQKMLDEEAEKTKELAKEAAKYTPYKFKGYLLHKETSFVFDKDKKVVGKSLYEEGDEMLGELEDSDRELCKKLNFEVEEE